MGQRLKRARPKWPASEVDLAAPVVAWLRDFEWDVYQEVTIGGGIVDIVAVRGPVVWVIETKVHMGLDVLAQAFDARTRAHRVSVAVPKRKRESRWFAKTVCDRLGLGLIEVEAPGRRFPDPHVEEATPGDFFRKAPAELIRKRLYEQQKTFAPAGTATGARWTPFAATCHEIRRVVAEEPGIDLKEAISRIRHHYVSASSARGALKSMIDRGIVKGVRVVKEGKGVFLFPQ